MFFSGWTLLHIYSSLVLMLKHAWTGLLAKCLVCKKGSSWCKSPSLQYYEVIRLDASAALKK